MIERDVVLDQFEVYYAQCEKHRPTPYEECAECRIELDSIIEDALKGRRSLLRVRRLSHRQRVDLDTMLLLASIDKRY